MKEFLTAKNYQTREEITTLKGIEGEVEVTVFTPKPE